MNIIEFEKTLVGMRRNHYSHPPVDIVNEGFRPVSGMVADFAVAAHAGRFHFFYIERRLKEGTPFYPGNEIYFGHASTGNFSEWEVHDPVMLIRPGTWEGAHVWAPVILRHCGRFVMAYTGVNEHISQDIGLAFSDDLFHWERAAGNPISPLRGRGWAAWQEDCISSCRDPHLLEHDGRIWMTFTANTREGASCIALASTLDLETWEDHGPILAGPSDGYEPRLQGGHPQGSLESAHLLRRGGRWHVMLHASVRDTTVRNWIFSSDRMDHFDFSSRREFWPGGNGIELVLEHGTRSLLAGFGGGFIRFGEVDWESDLPQAHFVTTGELESWRDAV